MSVPIAEDTAAIAARMRELREAPAEPVRPCGYHDHGCGWPDCHCGRAAAAPVARTDRVDV